MQQEIVEQYGLLMIFAVDEPRAEIVPSFVFLCRPAFAQGRCVQL
jgi:hypothetical protein